MPDLLEVVLDADKDLFVKFRDSQLTYDQLKARIAQRRYNIAYKCLDDLKEKGQIDPKHYENVEAFMPIFNLLYSQAATYKDVLRPLAPHEIDKRCLRSIKHTGAAKRP